MKMKREFFDKQVDADRIARCYNAHGIKCFVITWSVDKFEVRSFVDPLYSLIH